MQVTQTGFRLAAGCAATLGLVGSAQGHHGFGLFQMDQEAEWKGTITKMNLVNPHSYMELDAVGADGEITHMLCEMRAATLLRRAGWDTDIFVPGAEVEIFGRPHRDDPTACYIETVRINDEIEVGRNDQFVTENTVNLSNRPLRLSDGTLNLSGDWAVEQLVLTIGPEGGNGSMIPKSLIEEFASGEITAADIRALQPPRARAVLTEAGQAQSQTFDRNSPDSNPWFNCQPTSFIRDWTADWPINRFVQRTLADGEQVIDITYGLYNFERRIHLGMTEHPADIAPSYAGHSIGHWEGDALVVDTVGFAAGWISPPTPNSEQMRIVERFTLDPDTMSLKREYSVTDALYLTEPYESYDVMYLSDVPFQAQPCNDMTPEFQQ